MLNNCSERESQMCRSIKTLYNFDPPASQEEIQAAALQYVRKLSGFRKPSRSNEQAFQAAVEAVATASSQLLAALNTAAPARNREIEGLRARQRSAARRASGDLI
jgi:hypothetical protein